MTTFAENHELLIYYHSVRSVDFRRTTVLLTVYYAMLNQPNIHGVYRSNMSSVYCKQDDLVNAYIDTTYPQQARDISVLGELVS